MNINKNFKIRRDLHRHVLVGVKSPFVLVVDDESIIRQAHKVLLKNIGCKVDVVSDGYQALDRVTEEHNMIFMDIGLPGMSGVEAAIKIRQRYSQQNKIIIAVSTHTQNENSVFDAFIEKPLDMNKLQSIFNMLMK